VPDMTQPTGFSARRLHRLPVLAIAVAALVLGSSPALAEDAGKSATTAAMGPLTLVQSAVSRVMALIESQPDNGQRRAEVRQVAETLFDFNEMSRRTLAQHWSDRSPQEQEEFVRLFTSLLERSYLTVIGNYRLATVTFQREVVDGSSARVYSRIVTDRRTEIPVEYRLLQSAGQWAVYDVVAGDVSLVSSYRSQFHSIIRSSSFAGLLDKLRNREARLIPGAAQGP
jgi:phospholipid transport system substrate-binding protein